MSAEPARPGPDPQAGPAATVIAFRRPRRHSRETRVPIQPDPTPAQKLAAIIERTYADHGRSLTDEETALSYTIALGVLRTLLQGLREQGKLGEEEYALLQGMLDGMLEVPRLLA